MANNNFSGYGYGGAQYGGSHMPYPAITNSTYANASAYQQAAAAAAAGQTYPTSVSYADYRGALQTYDASKSFYHQATNNYSAGPTVSKTHYTAPPVKNVNAATQRVGVGNKSNGSIKPPLPPTAPPPTTTHNFGYDSSMFNASSLYAQQQSIAGTVAPVSSGVKPNGGTWFSSRRGSHAGGPSRGAARPKPAPRPQQLHYCESCKISCAGPQTYREHLEGQKHKKREASLKMQASAQATTQNRGNNYHCELCDVTCTGTDAYAAHVRGAKHQKVVKLHQKLGKPIPPDEPKKLGKISFVPAVAGIKDNEGGTNKTEAASVAVEPENAGNDDEMQEESLGADNADVIKPVGGEYIEEVKDDEGKIISFNCKLCECKFNDPNAKEMHTKGRRHRLQYKRKVQPDLVIDFKQTPRQRRMAEVRAQRALLHAPRGGDGDGAPFWDEQRRHPQFDNELDYNFMMRSFGGPPQRSFIGRVGLAPPFGMMPTPNIRRPESTDDRHAIAKHAAIYPKEEELQNIQRIVSHTERALKLISDELQEQAIEGQKKDGNQASLIRTVLRVGYLAKGLLLHGDKAVEFVALCTNKPTVILLKHVAELLPVKLKDVVGNETSPVYTVSTQLEEAAITVVDEGGISVRTIFTSPLLRETNAGGASKTTDIAFDESNDNSMLPRERCIEALAELRHSKWFSARATGLQSCVMVIRILRDMRQRIATWNALPQWALELLAEKVISSAGYPLTPGDCLRRIMEALASGLLVWGPGLLDPCEKEPTDALHSLTVQQREDITVSAQLFLRQIAFRQICRVLEMEQLAVIKFPVRPWRINRKRRRSSVRGAPDDSDHGTAADNTNPEKVPKKDGQA